jgi:N-acetylglucosaminyldiphosphoundecaprenol N-acetyl-beta-D-mannosaminyltransferase
MKNQYTKKIEIFGTVIDNILLEELFDKVDHLIQYQKKGYVVTPNVDHLVKLKNDAYFNKIYDNAYLRLNDSVIIKRAAMILGKEMAPKLSGSDLLPIISQYASQKNYTLYFLGGREGVAKTASEKLKEKYPALNVIGYYSPPFGFEKDQEEIRKIVSQINQCAPDILFVGLGAPKQEKFAYETIDQLDTNVIFCTGAAFDFQAGNVKRAPILFQKLGLEWFYRFLKEPRRLFKRYFVDDLKFLKIFLKEVKNRGN